MITRRKQRVKQAGIDDIENAGDFCNANEPSLDLGAKESHFRQEDVEDNLLQRRPSHSTPTTVNCSYIRTLIIFLSNGMCMACSALKREEVHPLTSALLAACPFR